MKIYIKLENLDLALEKMRKYIKRNLDFFQNILKVYKHVLKTLHCKT